MGVTKWTDQYSDIVEAKTYDKESFATAYIQRGNFVDSRGYLTDFAKDIMKELKCYTLEDLLNRLEGSGRGRNVSNDLDRNDVKVTGHMAEVLGGTVFGATQGGRGSDYQK